MDSFTTISTSKVDTIVATPVEQENGGSGSNAYCVVAAVPVDEENGGSGSNAYCVVA